MEAEPGLPSSEGENQSDQKASITCSCGNEVSDFFSLVCFRDGKPTGECDPMCPACAVTAMKGIVEDYGSLADISHFLSRLIRLRGGSPP